MAGLYLAALLALDSAVQLDAKSGELAMREAAGYLVRHLNSEGKFAYSVRFGSGSRTNEYNVVRHAGAIYALALYHDLTKDDEVQSAILRSGRFLLQRHVRPVRKQSAMQAVFSLPGEEIDGTNALIKLGACGLGLVALSKAHELDAEIVGLQILREIGNFILFMQQSNGRFRSVYDDASQSFGSFESLFYPGEAILGLACLHRVDPDTRWQDAAIKGLLYLEESRRNTPVYRLPADHWSIIATAAVLSQVDAARNAPAAHQRLVHHSRVIGKVMMNEQWRKSWLPGLNGSFVVFGAVPSSATRLEGLVALYTLLPPNDPDRERIVKSLKSGLGFVLRAQIMEGDLKGGFTGALRTKLSYQTQLAREIRIDYVEHALSALVGFQNIQRSSQH